MLFAAYHDTKKQLSFFAAASREVQSFLINHRVISDGSREVCSVSVCWVVLSVKKNAQHVLEHLHRAGPVSDSAFSCILNFSEWTPKSISEEDKCPRGRADWILSLKCSDKWVTRAAHTAGQFRNNINNACVMFVTTQWAFSVWHTALD